MFSVNEHDVGKFLSNGSEKSCTWGKRERKRDGERQRRRGRARRRERKGANDKGDASTC